MPGENWTRPPEEWQELIIRLLKARYAVGEFIPIPDKVHGDCGLEGFTRDGKGFQCYAAEEPLTTAELTKKQKVKVRTDLEKIVKYKDALTNLLGPTVLTHWILVVPRWEDKELLRYAEETINNIRSAGLPFVSPTIVPSICTAEDFIAERQMLITAGRSLLRVEHIPVDQQSLTDWASSNDELVANLDAKTLRIRNNDVCTAQLLRNQFLKHYLEGQNALSKLRADFPEIFEKIDRIKKDKEHFLVTESLTTSALPPEHLRETGDSLESQISEALVGLDKFTVNQFVHEALADWMLRCPLNF